LDGPSDGHDDNVIPGFNNDGQIAFHAEFSDGSTGVFVTTAPPASTLLLAAGALFVT